MKFLVEITTDIDLDEEQIIDFMIGLNSGMEEKIYPGSNWVSQTFSCDHETSAKFVGIIKGDN